MLFQVNTLADLTATVPRLLAALGDCRKVALVGQMGAGKTTLVRAICQHLGVREEPSSPTFSLVNEYSFPGADGATTLAHHLDLYRLKNLEEALDIGIEELLYDPYWCFIEWPEVIKPIWPLGMAVLHLVVREDENREMILENPERGKD